jgi:hypothetical protein
MIVAAGREVQSGATQIGKGHSTLIAIGARAIPRESEITPLGRSKECVGRLRVRIEKDREKELT